MKFFFTTLLLISGLYATAQTTVNLTEDLVLTETLVIENDVTYNGNGFKIICEGCNPSIHVKNGSRVHFEDVIFKKGYQRWMIVDGGNTGNVTWNSLYMRGHVRRSGQ
ncbi:hypothetical protein FUA23_13395 [Neolewinella aurantiaca]|uniref:Uncharacterized protein n=1 Tax=Neolewinella aurantiaca TaxID=2602767 RepID=A0A5C7FF06_9BACT|nr:hypothetical protein [Neolewinella aurantiaca]TXF88838.1 hypothetical protein FUA23_13395 [Neolewinella aurantiaca]